MASGGFTNLHVSGLPADCEDEDVEFTLHRMLSMGQLGDLHQQIFIKPTIVSYMGLLSISHFRLYLARMLLG